MFLNKCSFRYLVKKYQDAFTKQQKKNTAKIDDFAQITLLDC